MMASADAIRWRRAARAALIGGLLAAGGALSVWLDQAGRRDATVQGPVLAGWSALVAEAAQIEITTSNGALDLVRRTETSAWADRSRGFYPVRSDMIAALDAALGSLQLHRAMTRDAEKFDRLGLGEAARRVTLRDEDGSVLADLFVGAVNDATVYVRPADAGQAFAARGAAPPLDDAMAWLGLDFLQLEPRDLVRAEIMPETGPPYRLEKTIAGARHFTLRDPEGWRLVTAGAGNGVATAAATLRFRDVRPADEITGMIRARHAATTASGLGVIFTIRDEAGAPWALLEFRALTADAQSRADRFNAIASGWAYRLSEDAYERLTRPLAALADAP